MSNISIAIDGLVGAYPTYSCNFVIANIPRGKTIKKPRQEVSGTYNLFDFELENGTGPEEESFPVENWSAAPDTTALKGEVTEGTTIEAEATEELPN